MENEEKNPESVESVEIVERMRERQREQSQARSMRSVRDRPEHIERRETGGKGVDSQVFLKGIIVGFGLAAVASAACGLFKSQAAHRKEENSTGSRLRRQDESGNVLGDLSNIIDESSGAFRDAVKSLDHTFETGRKALDTFNDVVDKMRE